MHRHRPDRALGRIRAHGTYRADRPHGGRGAPPDFRAPLARPAQRRHRPTGPAGTGAEGANRSHSPTGAAGVTGPTGPAGRRRRGGTHGAYRRYRRVQPNPYEPVRTGRSRPRW